MHCSLFDDRVAREGFLKPPCCRDDPVCLICFIVSNLVYESICYREKPDQSRIVALCVLRPCPNGICSQSGEGFILVPPCDSPSPAVSLSSSSRFHRHSHCIHNHAAIGCSDGTATVKLFANAPVHFGTVIVGQSETQVVTVTNAGAASTTISALSVSSAEFSVPNLLLPLVLAAGQSVGVTVVFAPTATGCSGEESITFKNDSSGSGIELVIAGVGVEERTADCHAFESLFRTGDRREPVEHVPSC